MANPLAYWASLSVMKEKSFITLIPGFQGEDDGRVPAVDAAGAAAKVGELEPEPGLVATGLNGGKI
jgi:hypothetical protein